MEPTDPVAFVRYYNAWRVGGDMDMPDPSKITRALMDLCNRYDALAFAAARVEWKYGRTDDGKPKDWKEWSDLREALGDRVRQPQELGGSDDA